MFALKSFSPFMNLIFELNPNKIQRRIIMYLLINIFSIENFKRDEEEVEGLFQLFREKIRNILTRI